VWLSRIVYSFAVGIAGFDISPARSAFLLLPEHVHGADTLAFSHMLSLPLRLRVWFSIVLPVWYRNGRSLPHYYSSAPRRVRWW
jgi:hypothetical protein